MTDKILTFVLCSFLFSCKTTIDKKDEIFYVVKHPTGYNQNTEKKSPPIPPPPPQTFYGNLNFILFDDTTIYFHDKHIYNTCGYNTDNIRPPRMFLEPDSLRKIRIDSLPSFLEYSYSKTKNKHKIFFASISSPKDTIRNKGFVIISNFLHKNNVRNYNVRTWTEEEKFVAISKITNKKYSPDSITWKIGFAAK